MRRSIVVAALLSSAVLVAQKAERPVYFGATSVGFSATGRWVPSNPSQHADFPSETEIDCARQSRSCVEATAEYYLGHPHVSTEYYDIVKWDDNGLIAISSNAICTTQTLIVSFADKSITATHSIKKLNRETASACKTFEASGTFSKVFVVKNSERWMENPYGSSDEASDNASKREGYRVISYDSSTHQWTIIRSGTFDGKFIMKKLVVVCVSSVFGNSRPVYGPEACELIVGQMIVPNLAPQTPSDTVMVTEMGSTFGILEGFGDERYDQEFRILKNQIIPDN